MKHQHLILKSVCTLGSPTTSRRSRANCQPRTCTALGVPNTGNTRSNALRNTGEPVRICSVYRPGPGTWSVRGRTKWPPNRTSSEKNPALCELRTISPIPRITQIDPDRATHSSLEHGQLVHASPPSLDASDARRSMNALALRMAFAAFGCVVSTRS